MWMSAYQDRARRALCPVWFPRLVGVSPSRRGPALPAVCCSVFLSLKFVPSRCSLQRRANYDGRLISVRARRFSVLNKSDPSCQEQTKLEKTPPTFKFWFCKKKRGVLLVYRSPRGDDILVHNEIRDGEFYQSRVRGLSMKV
jgi:hypothetical protein